MSPKRLVCFVEGESDRDAVPVLVHRLVSVLPPELQAALFIDPEPFTVGNVNHVTGERGRVRWLRFLEVAAKRKPVGGVLVFLDGDRDWVEGKRFCPVEVARLLAERSADAGAGRLFSLAVVFVLREYESLLVTVAQQLPGLRAEAPKPTAGDEARFAGKAWLERNLTGGYKPSDHQEQLTRAVTDWTPARVLPSFRRLERAVTELAVGIATGQHSLSPRSLPIRHHEQP